ncbi:MAG TPA: ABC transporter substrate-binding protein, partial [Burkholderiales bacterium]|nr:ABC transporter substrate-binding protein [Burkholderiales bacterium]
MRELGYEVGKNLVIEARFADGRFDRCPALVAELLSGRPDVLVVGGTPAVEAVRQATSTIPVVMTAVGNPVASGFVASLARPGGNITGLSLDNADLAAKWFELARSVAPRSRIGVVANPSQHTHEGYARNIQSAAQSVGEKVPVVTARTVIEIDGAFAALARERVTTVIVLPNGLFNVNVERIAGLALKHRMASIGTTRSYA